MNTQWIPHDRHEEAVAAALANDKPILIYFHSQSCGGCRRLSEEVLAQPQVAQAIAESAIPVWVEVDTANADPRISSLVGSHIFIMSPVLQLISSGGDIFHKFLGAPLHTRLDLGYCRVHHDVSGDIDTAQFLGQLELGLGKMELARGDFAAAASLLSPLLHSPSGVTAREAAYWLPVAQNHGRYPEEEQPVAPLPAMSPIANEVRRFCSLICRIPDTELMADWPGEPRTDGGWAHYTDCLREVCLGVYQKLLDAGHRALLEREAQKQPLTQAQLILRDWQVSYRTLQGTLQGLGCAEWDRQHLHQNYSLGKQRTIRNNVVHCVMAEFWAHASAIRASRRACTGAAHDGKPPVAATWRKYGPPPANFGPMSDLMQLWEERHDELVEEFTDVSDTELDFEQSWWEGTHVSIRFRLSRLGWHLQDDAAVVETICERIGRVRTETERLAARIFTALGSSEGAMIGLAAARKNEFFESATRLLRAKSDEIENVYAHYVSGDAGKVPRVNADTPLAAA